MEGLDLEGKTVENSQELEYISSMQWKFQFQFKPEFRDRKNISEEGIVSDCYRYL